MTTLFDLIYPEELNAIAHIPQEDCTMKDFSDLTVKDLSSIAFILIRTEHGDGKMPECVLAAKAIEILTNRAIKLKLPLF